MVEENIHQHQEIETIKKWLLNEFICNGMNSQDAIEDKAWFLHDLELTPQGDERPSIVCAVYQTLLEVNKGKVLVADYVDELAKIMKDFERNMEEFNEGLNEKKESLKKLGSEIPETYAIYSKSNNVPKKTTCAVKPTKLECSRLGKYSIFITIGKSRRTVATNVEVKIKNNPVTIQVPSEFQFEITNQEENMCIQLFQGSKLVAEGKVPVFSLVSDLTPDTSGSGNIFESIEAMLSLSQEENVIAFLTFEILYSFSPSLFYKTIESSKKEQELFIQQFDKDINVSTDNIKEITDEFSQIKFDYMTYSFFSEEEELKEFKAVRKANIQRKPAPAPSSKSGTKHNDGCDCCVTF